MRSDLTGGRIGRVIFCVAQERMALLWRPGTRTEAHEGGDLTWRQGGRERSGRPRMGFRPSRAFCGNARSRRALDRLLDTKNTGVTLHTLQRAAAAVGRQLRLELV